MGTGTIYCLENLVNGKMYIGQTVDFDKRMRSYSYGGHGVIGESIEKYGWESFKAFPLHEDVPLHDIDALERYCIWIFQTIVPEGYNVRYGGGGGFISESARQKMSKSHQIRLSEGTHFLQTDNPSPKRIADGTHHFLTDNPMYNPEVKEKFLKSITSDEYRKNHSERMKKDAEEGNHPMQNPEIAARVGATRKRKEREDAVEAGQIFFC